MLATNHGLSGALIASVLPLPIALPVAFASHFILDSLPHYGITKNQRNKSQIYRLIVTGDIMVALTGLLGMAVLHKWNMEAGAWVAWSPDLLWVIYYFTHNKTLQINPQNKFMKFHLVIQRYERPWGIIVEATFFIILLPVYIHRLVN
jgi:hypothetical protein